MSWEAAKTRAKECETKLTAIPGDPQKDLQKLGRQLKALEEAETKARDEENQAEGRLQTLAAEGAYSKLAACEEKLSDLKSRIHRERLRMDATKLLYDTVTSCKAAMVAAVAALAELLVALVAAREAHQAGVTERAAAGTAEGLHGGPPQPLVSTRPNSSSARSRAPSRRTVTATS